MRRVGQEAQRLSGESAVAIREDLTVLLDRELANHYLQVLDHFTNRRITQADLTDAEDGLTPEEINQIVGSDSMRRRLTSLYTQGYCEFRSAGASDHSHFIRLEETIVEQYVWGNPTATHNYLRIGYGTPENNILGISHRNSGILYYDNEGLPLPSLGGVGMRDHGYIGAIQPDRFGINIANISDPGLRLLLNALRQTFSDPTRTTITAARVYFENIERVNSVVQRGLPQEVVQAFEEMLPVFILFLAGHATATFLQRMPNPIAVAIGLALKGMLIVAGYVMSIDFAAGALERLFQSARELSRVRVRSGELTELSTHHLERAAVPLRRMVIDIALMAGTMALGVALRSLRGGGRSARIECTNCRLLLLELIEARIRQMENARGDLNYFRGVFSLLRQNGARSRMPLTGKTGVAQILSQLLTPFYTRRSQGTSIILESIDGRFSIRITPDQLGPTPVRRGSISDPRIHIYEGRVTDHGSHIRLQDQPTAADVMTAIEEAFQTASEASQ